MTEIYVALAGRPCQCHEFTDGDTITSVVLPGFEVAFDELITADR